MNSGNHLADKNARQASQNTSDRAGNSANLAASPRGDLTLILILLAIFIFHSPFTNWWSSLGLPWYSIFIFWLLLIVMLAIIQLIKSNKSSKQSQ